MTVGAVAMPLRTRRRLSAGPALGRAPLPVAATVISALVHGTLAAAVIIGAGMWSARQPRTYVINLVPAIAASGTPVARPTPAPVLPQRPNAATARAPTRPADLPARDTPPQMPARDTPPQMPARDTPPQMPARETRTASAVPDRTMPSRAPALPRAGDKELPTVPSTTSTKPLPAPAPVTPPRPETAAPPPTPLPGRPSGSALGSGAVTLNVSDFPFAWYTRVVVSKVTDGWAARALEGRQPVAVFDIGRDGQVSKLSIEKSSGNPYYDQAALRAITSANPFPPLPQDFKEPFLRVHMGFNFASERG